MAASSSSVSGRRNRRDNKEKIHFSFRVGTLNVGTLNVKFLEIVDMLKKIRVDVVCIKETKWKGIREKKVMDLNCGIKGL